MIKVTYYHSPNTEGVREITDSRIISNQKLHSAENLPYLCLRFQYGSEYGEIGAICNCSNGKIELEYVD